MDKKLFNKYSEIYKDNFLKETQDDKKIFYADNINKSPLRAKNSNTGPNKSVYKSYKSAVRLTKHEIDMLTLNEM